MVESTTTFADRTKWCVAGRVEKNKDSDSEHVSGEDDTLLHLSIEQSIKEAEWRLLQRGIEQSVIPPNTDGLEDKKPPEKGDKVSGENLEETIEHANDKIVTDDNDGTIVI